MCKQINQTTVKDGEKIDTESKPKVVYGPSKEGIECAIGKEQ